MRTAAALLTCIIAQPAINQPAINQPAANPQPTFNRPAINRPAITDAATKTGPPAVIPNTVGTVIDTTGRAMVRPLNNQPGPIIDQDTAQAIATAIAEAQKPTVRPFASQFTPQTPTQTPTQLSEPPQEIIRQTVRETVLSTTIITVRTDPGAVVHVGNQRMTRTGPARQYITDHLDITKRYAYQITATSNGRTVTKTVEFNPGINVEVDLHP